MDSIVRYGFPAVFNGFNAFVNGSLFVNAILIELCLDDGLICDKRFHGIAIVFCSGGMIVQVILCLMNLLPYFDK